MNLKICQHKYGFEVCEDRGWDIFMNGYKKYRRIKITIYDKTM